MCTYLSAVLLVGLLVNATLGWSWADPLAGLVIAAVAAKEGRDAWRGEGCCSPAGAGGGHAHEPADASGCACGSGCDCCPPTAGGVEAPAGATRLDLTAG